jgi:predicted nucleotidyltransferase
MTGIFTPAYSVSKRTGSDGPELNELLQGWVEAISEILDDNFVGAYLEGSFALGDADIHSDCDFLVVVAIH